MRAIVLGIVAILCGLGLPALAENSPGSGRPISETLPLFEKNHCAAIQHPADQLFCGDPDLSDAGAKLAVAIQDRLNRIPNHRHAIAENAEWIRDRNSSCGIFGSQGISNHDFNAVKMCLLKETGERMAILADPNFDCLATNTTAGLLICGDPALAIAKMELNSHVLGLIAKLKGDDAKAAFAEYERWSRERDRTCNLTDKDNVPLEELSSSENCLAEHISRKTAEIMAANGDPKRIFGKCSFSRRLRSAARSHQPAAGRVGTRSLENRNRRRQAGTVSRWGIDCELKNRSHFRKRTAVTGAATRPRWGLLRLGSR